MGARACALILGAGQRNNRLVWDETVRIVTELFDEVWGPKDEIVVDDECWLVNASKHWRRASHVCHDDVL